MSRVEVKLIDLGEMQYKDAWDYQTKVHNEIKQRKLDNRNKSDQEKEKQEHFFLVVEHPHVYTLGKSGSEEHLLIDKEKREKEKIDYFKINRGGDITYHGPGQIVGYPILDMDEIFTDIHKYVRYLEEAIIRTCADYGVESTRIEGYTGVWIKDPVRNRKICAIGVHLSRWVTMHGFAFNVNTNLDYFNYIVPCGIDDDDKTVTSLSKEVGHELDMLEVRNRILYHFAEIFDINIIS